MATDAERWSSLNKEVLCSPLMTIEGLGTMSIALQSIHSSFSPASAEIDAVAYITTQPLCGLAPGV